MNQQVEDALGGFESKLTSAEYAMLLRPNAEPRPEAERRVFAWKHNQDKPFDHADRRRGGL